MIKLILLIILSGCASREYIPTELVPTDDLSSPVISDVNGEDHTDTVPIKQKKRR